MLFKRKKKAQAEELIEATGPGPQYVGAWPPDENTISKLQKTLDDLKRRDVENDKYNDAAKKITKQADEYVQSKLSLDSREATLKEGEKWIEENYQPILGTLTSADPFPPSGPTEGQVQDIFLPEQGVFGRPPIEPETIYRTRERKYRIAELVDKFSPEPELVEAEILDKALKSETVHKNRKRRTDTAFEVAPKDE